MVPPTVENYGSLAAVEGGGGGLEREASGPRQGFTLRRGPLDGYHRSCGTATRSPEVAELAAFYGDWGLRQPHPRAGWHTPRMVRLHRQRFERDGHGRTDQAIVGLGGQVFMRADSQDVIDEFRPYFDNAPHLRVRPVAGGVRGRRPR